MAQAYLNYLVPVSVENGVFVFAIRLKAAKNWIEERYLSCIREAVSAVLGSPHGVLIELDDTLVKQTPSHQVRTSAEENSPASPSLGQHSQTTTSYQQEGPSTINASAHNSSLVQNNPNSTQTFSLDQSVSKPLGGSSSDIASMGTGLESVFALDDNNQSAAAVEKNSRYTFSNYVKGESNMLAFNTSLGVAEHPGQLYNPLFIHGKSGLGKTHLLLAIKNYINKYSPESRVVYAPTSELVSDFTNAMTGGHSIDKFKDKYHFCDILLLDDVQTLEGKVETSNALFEIFNMFTGRGKQIVLSADRSPMEINLDERFTSRFSQGIKADIQPPNYEMKLAIINNYKSYCCNNLNIAEVAFSDEAIQKIIELSGSNIRELEGAVINLIVSSQSRSGGNILSPVTVDDVSSTLGNSFFHKNTHRIDCDMVIKAVESFFSVSREELFSEKRSKNISHPRQVAMYLIRRHTDMSYPEIGDSFNKDHTTAMYADRNI